MAAVSVSPLPHSLSSMSGRRAPLSSIPNAVNSPYRGMAGAAASKQKRSYAHIQREDAYGQPPPAKKQMLEQHQALKTPTRQQSNPAAIEGRAVGRKSNGLHPSTFERKLVAAREKPVQQSISRAERTSEENLESIRQWQKHHRKLFPTFVFYFESIPEETRLKYTKQVIALGAREEKFFSNAVTHVVTTRAIPPEHDGSSPQKSDTSSNKNASQSQTSHLQTINPSLLDRSFEPTNTVSDALGSRGRFTFEVSSNKRLAATGHDFEAKRQNARNTDVLHRARKLGMKIWALEKLQRMMTTMLNTETGYHTTNGQNTRSHSVPATVARPGREADLSQLLKNERINGPSDRDPTVATKEMVIFKGFYIYIHDIDEKQRPIMVREYAKVTHKEDGDWPQFRSVPNGKCPFVDEVDKREVEKEKEALRIQKQQEKEQALVPATRSAVGRQTSRMEPPNLIKGKPVLSEVGDGSNRHLHIPSKQPNPFDPRKPVSRYNDLVASSRGNQNAFVSRAGAGRLLGGEPVASGLQASNLTSAIRSQRISSTAAQPGAKAGTSKEVHGLQRKVLERNSGGPGSYGLTSSHRMTDISAAAREEAACQARKRRHQEPLGLIEEDSHPSDAEQQARQAEAARKLKAIQQRKLEKRDAKPGYCENCQDKFDDFDEHILSRKHRKFAERQENWAELDSLLKGLARPLHQSEHDDANDN